MPTESAMIKSVSMPFQNGAGLRRLSGFAHQLRGRLQPQTIPVAWTDSTEAPLSIRFQPGLRAQALQGELCRWSGR